jgi:SAM-dependent methyltransferase
MTYYNDEKNVAQYISMAEGYDGKLLIAALREFLPAGASLLELGMGPGKDLLLLGQHYTVTGSDSSPIFLDRFRQVHPDADLVQLDATTLDTDRQFDGLYSNKVLYHLTRDQLVESFKQQARVLKPGGIALHAFWHGDGDEEMHGLFFAYYTEATLRASVGNELEILRVARYTEAEPDDSLYIVLRRR